MWTANLNKIMIRLCVCVWWLNFRQPIVMILQMEFHLEVIMNIIIVKYTRYTLWAFMQRTHTKLHSSFN